MLSLLASEEDRPLSGADGPLAAIGQDAFAVLDWLPSEGDPLLRPIDDPLGYDLSDEKTMLVSPRGLARMAFVAAQVGMRHGAGEIEDDPGAWMLGPRRLFGGLSACEACLDRDHYLRAVLLHGLAIGMDAEPDVIDGLLQGSGPGSSDPPSDQPGGRAATERRHADRVRHAGRKQQQ